MSCHIFNKEEYPLNWLDLVEDLQYHGGPEPENNAVGVMCDKFGKYYLCNVIGNPFLIKKSLR